MTTSLQDRIETLAAGDRRYAPEAYHFIFQALDFVLERQQGTAGAASDRHVSAQQLLDGCRDYALAHYGPLARLVLERWGLYRTEDFGELVWSLVDCRLLNKQETDRKSDFRNGFSFREAFDGCWWLPTDTSPSPG